MKRCEIVKKWKNIPLALKVSVSYAICSVIQNCLGLITLPLFTRILTTEQFGQATVYASWSSLLVIFITLQLPYGSFSKAMVKFEDSRNEYIASVEGICILLATIFLLLFSLFRNILEIVFELPPIIMVIMIFEILANAGIAFWSGKKRFEFRYKEVIAVTLIAAIVSPILQYILIISTENKGYAKIIGGALVNIVLGGVIFILNIYRGKKLYNREFWKYALGFNIPLLAYYLSQMIFNTSDRIMISHMCGTDKAAVYGVAYNVGVMLNFVLVAINNSYLPWFYEKLKKRKQEECKIVTNAIAALMAVLLLGVIWFAPEIIKILGGKAYMEAVWIVPPVAMSILLLFYSQLAANYAFFFEKKFFLVKASIIAAGTNIMLNAIFIPVFNYYAAGYTTLFSYLLFTVANYCAMRKIMKEENMESHGYDVTKLIKIFSVFMLLGFSGMAIYNSFLLRGCILIGVFLILIFNYKKIVVFLEKIRNEWD